MAGEAILIVDDDDFMRELIAESLGELEYWTIPVGTVKDALHAVSINEIEVALIDLSLRDGTGLEVVDTIIDGSPDTQIIIMTGYPSIQSAIDALRRGAQDYIIKPFKMPEIHAAVARSLKNQRLEAEVRQLRRKVRDQDQELVQLTCPLECSQS
jgi:DNA-binding NtrC family response regulator